ncbi:MAG: SPOR domain-containing protein [Candidatus Omnitrophica bacterium]|nr:SPOR domain-containing protein [Candidatus Omnitrophota bacterium]MDD5591718.1 SPOR domain-containing protein [Candidatus Omnitrophota bacterium]
MKREEAQQLELFSQTREPGQKETRLSGLLLNFIRGWEKTILIIIGLAITGIVCFSLGVERGKRIVRLKTDSRLDIALKAQKAQPKAAALAPRQADTQAQAAQQSLLPPNYTIQVASFINRKNAQREADILKKKGLSTMVLSKGKFTIVCVGNFPNKQEAEFLLPKLKKQYQDCRVRRL